MMGALGDRWRAFSLREKRLIVAMVALAAALVLWLGVIRPVNDALAEARAAVIVANDREAAVRAAVDLLGPARRARLHAAGQLVGLIEQSAAGAGLELQTNAPAGPDGATIALSGARPSAVFAWLGHMQQEGIAVETIDVQPSANNTVGVHAVLRWMP